MVLAKFGDTVAIQYTGRSNDSSICGTRKCYEPLQLTMGQDARIPFIEKTVIGMGQGQCKTIRIAVAEAYGLYRKEWPRVVSRGALAKGLPLHVKQRLGCTRMDGRTFAATVTGVSEKNVTLDANHLWPART